MKKAILFLMMLLCMGVVYGQSHVNRPGCKYWKNPNPKEVAVVEAGWRCPGCVAEEKAQAEKAQREREAKRKAEEAERKRQEEKSKAEQKRKDEEYAKEKAERERKVNVVMPTSSGSSSGGSKSSGSSSNSSTTNSTKDDSEEEKGSASKSGEKVYIPKTSSQKYDELKTMAAKYPEMMNDPKFRQQMRHLEVDANREQTTLREYRSGTYRHGNYQAIASQMATNQRVDTYTKVAGDVTDAVQGLVGSILNESLKKSEERRLRIQNEINDYWAKKTALNAYHDDMKRERSSYTNSIHEDLDAKYSFVWPAILAPVMIDTEVEDSENIRTFKRTKLRIGYVYAYVVVEGTYEEGQKFGLAADNGNIIYPPQFEGIVKYEDDNGTVSFIVNIADKWGEIDAGGRVIDEIKYDGLWYTVDGIKIVLQGNQWTFVDKNGKTEKYTAKDLKGKQVILSNVNTKDHSYANMFSSYLYILDFEKGVYASHLYGKTGLHKLITYGLNKEKDENKLPVNINEKWKYNSHYTYLFKKDNIWYRADIHSYTKTTYTLIKMPDNFVVAVNDSYLEEKTGKAKWGAINQDSQIIIPFEHEYLSDFENGKALSDKGIYNVSGKLVNTNKYAYLSDYDNGVALFHDKKSTGSIAYGLVDDEGNEVVRLYENSLSSVPKSMWFNLGNELSRENNTNKNLELAIYCYGKDDNPGSSGMSYYYAGKLYYHEAGKEYEPQALDYFLKASESVIWNYIGNDMRHAQRGRFSIKMSELYNLRYIGAMYFKGQGTVKSQKDANAYFEKLIRKGEQIIKDFGKKGSSVDITSTYYYIGEAYEYLGNKKQATKYYKLSKTTSANDRLKAIEEGRMYSF